MFEQDEKVVNAVSEGLMIGPGGGQQRRQKRWKPK
ncbi:MAG: hypothetical protein K0S24_1741 [Sphingobacterium sp.]|jgi:hypothetical protein|nr:hypothetical protein [Sphingobacterium sp.]